MSIAHHVVGSGPRTVLLTHGWFGSADGWGPFVDYLDGEAARWVFTDVRGFGRAPRRAGRPVARGVRS